MKNLAKGTILFFTIKGILSIYLIYMVVKGL